MNILPKKRWHVRTKENMARVRKDVREAEEKEKAILDREILATNEARLAALRKTAGDRIDTMFGVKRSTVEESVVGPSPSTSGHINFFEELEQEEAKNVGDTNKEYEEEKKKEQAAWDTKMGIQMKLGDDGNEGKGYWFDKIPLRRSMKEMKKIEEEDKMKKAKMEREEEEKRMKQANRKRKAREESEESSSEEEKRKERKKKSKKEKKKERKHDKKDKKDKKSKKKKRRRSRSSPSSSASEDEEVLKAREEAEKKARLIQLRDERIKRERMEQAKTQLILHPELARKKEEEAKKNAPKYNSMFNPHIAR
ncbi:hypothetical protein PFISCL1PPCAC_25896 [Pristionchus fissidentatus]|uniref:CBF1-interacting co-repressor CIR N-terminal domain-containing protein n=1 Tax=Pristionchus fissidentatus TaxID=1538716 RepID=A0AAV5WYJ1_9BILA|nr:hypothetical protein PFISCL1PPCAC_25896 [Pristionchus fissidentatus]